MLKNFCQQPKSHISIVKNEAAADTVEALTEVKMATQCSTQPMLNRGCKGEKNISSFQLEKNLMMLTVILTHSSLQFWIKLYVKLKYVVCSSPFVFILLRSTTGARSRLVLWHPWGRMATCPLLQRVSLQLKGWQRCRCLLLRNHSDASSNPPEESQPGSVLPTSS